jgi:hypothetical protein
MRRLVIASLLFVLVVYRVPPVSAKLSPIAPVRPLWVATASNDDVDATTPDLPESPGDHFRQICTANSINEDLGLWITAAHCLEHGKVYIEQMIDDPLKTHFHAAVVIDLDPSNDIGVLITRTLRVTSFKLASHEPRVGDSVGMMGFPMAFRRPIYLLGTVAVLDLDVMLDGTSYGHKMLFNMTACGGNSGSAVLNGDGELISVLQIGFGRPCSSLTGGVTYAALRERVGRYFKQ